MSSVNTNNFFSLLHCPKPSVQWWLSAKSEHACVAPNLIRKVFSVTTKYIVSCRFFTDAFIRLRRFPSITSLLTVFITKRCWILSSGFSVPTWSHTFVFYIINRIYFINLHVLNQLSWSWCMLPSICHQIWFATIVLKICSHKEHWSILFLQFFFVWHSYQGNSP